MARTISEIYNEIILEKQNQTSLNTLQPAIDDVQTLLNDLTSTSKVAIWRLWAYIIAVAIWVHESLWDKYKADIQVMLDNAIPGTIRWYHIQSMAFQLGDALEWINNKFQYIDSTSSTAIAKRIIKRCAVYESGNQLIIKVAKETAGIPEALSVSEKSAFQAYVNQVKFAGTKTVVLSYPPDELKISLDIAYDPLVLDSTGKKINDANYPVNDALEEFVKNIVFAGALNKTKLVDAIQLAEGVVDVVLTNIEAKVSGGVYNVVSGQNYDSTAGYMIIDSITANYIPNV